MKDYVNWAVMAPGNIANSMAMAMSKSRGAVHLYTAASRDLERAQAFANKWGFEKAYGSYEELLEDENVDAVYISNPHAFHFDSVMKCLNAGKHVLCEKPAGCNISELKEMIKAAEDKNLFFMEAMWTAFNPCIKQIKKWISDGKIGELKHIQSFFCNRVPFDPKNRLWAPELAGGALLDLGIYNIYFAMLINDFNPVSGRSSSVRIENKIDAWNSVCLTFKNGVTTSFESACDMPSFSKTHDAVIYGTKGFITVPDFFLTQNAELHVYTNCSGNENNITEKLHVPFSVNGYEYELIEATKCILDGKKESLVHPHARSVELCNVMDALRSDWNMTYPFEKK